MANIDKIIFKKDDVLYEFVGNNGTYISTPELAIVSNIENVPSNLNTGGLVILTDQQEENSQVTKATFKEKQPDGSFTTIGEIVPDIEQKIKTLESNNSSTDESIANIDDRVKTLENKTITEISNAEIDEIIV